MRRRLLVGVTLVAAACPAYATAAPVLVLHRHGRVTVRNDPFLTGPAITPVPLRAGPPSGAIAADLRSRHAASHARRTPRAAQATPGARQTTSRPAGKPAHKGRRRRHVRQITFLGELARLHRRHRIGRAAYRQAAGSFRSALRAEHRLHGVRRTELEAVTETMHQIAASHQLTPSRLPALVATLDANRRWWTSGSLPAADQRIEFTGSQLVWEYYPGQGIHLQVLGTFGKADGLYTAGPEDYPQLVQLLSEMIPLAARRGGGLAWEYYFSFDGGSPPWTSAMSQATGLEALTRAFDATGDYRYLNVATRSLPIFSAAPPVGVGVKTARGTRFLQYTFAPGTQIINAFLQTLIGLYDFAQASGNPIAADLFAAGNAEAQAEVPDYDTGAWSLYQPGIEDTLSYHELVTGFLTQLCTRTSAPVYCTTAQHFRTDLTTPPAIAQRTFRARARHGFALRFSLSKYSHVGIVVTRGRRTVFQTSASFPYGVDSFAIPRLRSAGTYGVVLTATGLAGNFTRVTGSLQVGR